MEFNETKEQIKNQNPHKNKVHKILAHSYLFYFFTFLIGLFLDFIFPLKISPEPILISVGIILILVASFLILWAQKTSRNFKKETITKKNFRKGPYFFTRTPTHWGLAFLMIGFGIIANTVFIILFTIVAFVATKLIFLRKEEQILTEKYGAPYLEYKKSVRI